MLEKTFGGTSCQVRGCEQVLTDGQEYAWVSRVSRYLSLLRQIRTRNLYSCWGPACRVGARARDVMTGV